MKLTPQLIDALAAAIAQGVPLETAATAAGLNNHTVHDWLEAAERGTWRWKGILPSPRAKELLADLADKVHRARAEWEAKQIAGITRAAEQVNEKTGQHDWRARAWLLNNHPTTRTTYHEHRTSSSESHSTVDHRHVIVRELATHDLLALEQGLVDDGDSA